MSAATGIITTVAGIGDVSHSYSGDNGPATSATLYAPKSVAVDSVGNLYIADQYNQRIRMVSVTTPPLTFSQTNVSDNSATQTFTLANIGNAPLNLSAIAPSTNFTTDASTTTCSTSAALAAGDSCAVGIVFSPTTIGSFNGTLTLTDNALNLAGSTRQVNLAGIGIGTQTTTVAFQSITPASPTYGQTESISVSVAAQSGPSVPSTGSVTFTVDGNPQPAIPLGTNGAVGLQLSGLKAGLHQVGASYGGSTDGTYLASNNVTSFTIAPAATTLSWTPAANSQAYGRAMGASVLNASVSGSVAGAISYTATPFGGQAAAITAATILPAGSYTLTGTFTPTDAADYTAATAQVNFVVSQATPIITWATPAAITSGTALSSTQLNATCPSPKLTTSSFIANGPAWSEAVLRTGIRQCAIRTQRSARNLHGQIWNSPEEN